MKKCSTCKLIKPLNEFNKCKSNKDLHHDVCKMCRKLWYIKNKDKIKKYCFNNKDRRSKNFKRYREEHKKELAEYNKKYKKEHQEELTEYNKKYCNDYYQKNKYKLLEYGKQWRKKNPDKVRQYSRKRRALKQKLQENYTKTDEEYTRSLFNNQCAKCNSKENLYIDHHYPLSKGYPLTRQNAVLLCQSCNCSKQEKHPTEFYDSNILQKIEEKLFLTNLEK